MKTLKAIIIGILALLLGPFCAFGDTACNEFTKATRQIPSYDNPCWSQDFKILREWNPPAPIGVGYQNIYPQDYFTIQPYDVPQPAYDYFWDVLINSGRK